MEINTNFQKLVFLKDYILINSKLLWNRYRASLNVIQLTTKLKKNTDQYE